MITPKNILSHELIGMHVTITRSTCKSLHNIDGNIMYETKKSLFLRTTRGIKQIMKEAAKQITIDGRDYACFINGQTLIGRPEDRIARPN